MSSCNLLTFTCDLFMSICKIIISICNIIISTCVIIMFTCDLSYIHVDINKSHVNNTSCLACREQNYANIRLLLGHLSREKYWHAILLWGKLGHRKGWPVAMSLAMTLKQSQTPFKIAVYMNEPLQFNFRNIKVLQSTIKGWSFSIGLKVTLAFRRLLKLRIIFFRLINFISTAVEAYSIRSTY